MEILGLIDIPLWILIPAALLITIYLYGTWHFGAFDGLGLPGPKPYPFVGTIGPAFSKGFLVHDAEIMRTYGKVVAMYNGRTPTVFTSDEDIIKTICIKENHKFTDKLVLNNGEELASIMLFAAKGDQWRRLRHLLSPAFSTGKLKRMSFHVNRCARVFTDNMREYADSGNPCVLREVIQGFTMDTIAATLFSLEVNSQKDPDNPFVKMGRQAFRGSTFSPALLISFFLPCLLPIRAKLNLTFIPEDVIQFFSDVTTKAMADRQKNPGEATDFLTLIMNAHEDVKSGENDVTDPAINKNPDAKPDLKKMSYRELLAQAIMFFIVGFDTIAVALTYLCYNLATHPETQEKLYQEIRRHLKDEDAVEYSTLTQMTYLDQCVSESLRLYPPAFRSDRVCTQDCTIKGIHFKKGWGVFFPVYAMQRDPDVWEDPDVFKPERFEDMSKITYHYMPFGVGPRNCIGQRLALLEVKTAIVHLIRDYRLTRIPETIFPMKFDPKKFMHPTDPIRIGIEKRS